MKGATVFESKDGVRQGVQIRGQQGDWCKSYFWDGIGFGWANYKGFEFAKKYGTLNLSLRRFQKRFDESYRKSIKINSSSAGIPGLCLRCN